MKRRSVNITDRQRAALQAEAKRIETSENDVLCRLLDRWIDGESLSSTTIEPEPETVVYDASITGGTKVVRVWEITKIRIDDLLYRYPHLTQIALLDRLVNAPDEILQQILSGDYQPAITTTEPTDPTFIDFIDGTGEVGYFLADHCVKAPGLSVTKADFYLSFEHYLGDGIEMPPREEIIETLRDKYGFSTSEHDSKIVGVGFRKTAYAVIAHGAAGYEPI